MGLVICDRAIGLVEKIGPIGWHHHLDFYYGFYTFFNVACIFFVCVYFHIRRGYILWEL